MSKKTPKIRICIITLLFIMSSSVIGANKADIWIKALEGTVEQIPYLNLSDSLKSEIFNPTSPLWTDFDNFANTTSAVITYELIVYPDSIIGININSSDTNIFKKKNLKISRFTNKNKYNKTVGFYFNDVREIRYDEWGGIIYPFFKASQVIHLLRTFNVDPTSPALLKNLKRKNITSTIVSFKITKIDDDNFVYDKIELKFDPK